MNFASKVNGMKACCSDQANATNTIARPRTPTKNLEAGCQIAVIGHLLGQPPDERPHQHAVESGRQWQGPKRYGGVSVPYKSQPAA